MGDYSTLLDFKSAFFVDDASPPPNCRGLGSEEAGKIPEAKEGSTNRKGEMSDLNCRALYFVTTIFSFGKQLSFGRQPTIST